MAQSEDIEMLQSGLRYNLHLNLIRWYRAQLCYFGDQVSFIGYDFMRGKYCFPTVSDLQHLFPFLYKGKTWTFFNSHSQLGLWPLDLEWMNQINRESQLCNSEQRWSSSSSNSTMIVHKWQQAILTGYFVWSLRVEFSAACLSLKASFDFLIFPIYFQ